MNFINCSLNAKYQVMAKIQWKLRSKLFSNHFEWLVFRYKVLKLAFISLFYNEFADRYYIGDTCMEPMFWFVDHFTKILGPVCVIGVILLTLSMIAIAYIIGLSFYMECNIFILLSVLIIGHWILINIIFYYYMAYMTEPGYPPQGAMITEAVSICKKCIAPKPPRTHHCSICNRCILKMDHHCPWLNNCIGHFNHRYFFMFCVYIWIGAIFILIFGIPVAYEHFFENTQTNDFPTLSHNATKNTTAILVKQEDKLLHGSIKNKYVFSESFHHSCIVYAALLCIAVLLVVGGLISWHSLLINKGETSIESHINKRERERFKQEGKVYENPYDFGPAENWKIFLGLGYHRSWFYILLPYIQAPYGDGLHWNMLNVNQMNENKKDVLKSCYIKIS